MRVAWLYMAIILSLTSNRVRCFHEELRRNNPQNQHSPSQKEPGMADQQETLFELHSSNFRMSNYLLGSPMSSKINRDRQADKAKLSMGNNQRTSELDLAVTEKPLDTVDKKGKAPIKTLENTINWAKQRKRSSIAKEIKRLIKADIQNQEIDIIDPYTGKVIGLLKQELVSNVPYMPDGKTGNPNTRNAKRNTGVEINFTSQRYRNKNKHENHGFQDSNIQYDRGFNHGKRTNLNIRTHVKESRINIASKLGDLSSIDMSSPDRKRKTVAGTENTGQNKHSENRIHLDFAGRKRAFENRMIDSAAKEFISGISGLSNALQENPEGTHKTTNYVKEYVQGINRNPKYLERQKYNFKMPKSNKNRHERHVQPTTVRSHFASNTFPVRDASVINSDHINIFHSISKTSSRVKHNIKNAQNRQFIRPPSLDYRNVKHNVRKVQLSKTRTSYSNGHTASSPSISRKVRQIYNWVAKNDHFIQSTIEAGKRHLSDIYELTRKKHKIKEQHNFQSSAMVPLTVRQRIQNISNRISNVNNRKERQKRNHVNTKNNWYRN